MLDRKATSPCAPSVFTLLNAAILKMPVCGAVDLSVTVRKLTLLAAVHWKKAVGLGAVSAITFVIVP